MPNLKNRFYFRELRIDGPFCNREEEQKEQASPAQSLANLVLYSPRIGVSICFWYSAILAITYSGKKS